MDGNERDEIHEPKKRLYLTEANKKRICICMELNLVLKELFGGAQKIVAYCMARCVSFRLFPFLGSTFFLNHLIACSLWSGVDVVCFL